MKISENKLRSIIRSVLKERYLEPEEYDQLEDEGEIFWDESQKADQRELDRDQWMHKYVPGTHSRRVQKKKYKSKYKSKRQRWAEDPKQVKIPFNRGGI